jgi:hypothetical protein
VPFLISNLSVYDSFFSPYYEVSPYYQTDRISSDHFFEALAGHLISPSRGFFVFTPVFIFSIFGVLLKIRNSSMEMLEWLLVTIVALHWVSISFYTEWFGGHSFGNRYMSDMIPYFMYFLIPVVASISRLDFPKFDLLSLKRVAWVSIFSVLAVASVAIHYRGATDFDTLLWNTEPTNIAQDTDRIWSLDDVQFMRR